MIIDVSHLGTFERQVVLDIVDRLAQGQTQYGRFLEHDPRDYGREAYEEALDGAVYLARLLRRLTGAK